MGVQFETTMPKEKWVLALQLVFVPVNIYNSTFINGMGPKLVNGISPGFFTSLRGGV